jgi:hypothetical protein
MPSTAFQRPVRSNPTTDFAEALTTNQASATVNLVLPTRDPFWFIRAFTLVAKQNLAYEIQAYARATNLGGTIATDYFIGVWQFMAMSAGPPASPGYPVDAVDISPADTLYHYYVDGNMMPYYDADQLDAANSANAGGTYPKNAELHLRLVNRSAGSKSAGTAGALQLTVFVAAQGQQV